MKIITHLSFIIFAAVLSGCKMERPAAVNANTPPSGMVLVEGGTFQMGSENGDTDERPVHAVTLSPFYIDKCEVTYEKWVEVRTWARYHGYTDLTFGQNGFDTSGISCELYMPPGARVQPWGMVQKCNELTDGPSEGYVITSRYGRNVDNSILALRMRRTILWLYTRLRNGYRIENKNNPVTLVGWAGIIQWCNARSEMEGLKPVYYVYGHYGRIIRKGDRIPTDADWNANGYRLPTDAEWEFAARGGMHSRNYEYSGSDKIGDVAWDKENSGGTTHPVGLKQANELGLFDMTGNVEETVQGNPWDTYPSIAQVNPRTGLEQISARGGSCLDGLHRCRNTNRTLGGDRYPWAGFRCVRGAVQ